MSQDDLLLLAGQISGMAFKVDAADFEELARLPQLTATNAALIGCVARFRKSLDDLFGDDILTDLYDEE